MYNEQHSINALRVLSVDAINKANSGHPGMILGAAPMAYTLFTKHLNINPDNSTWFNRDRFILAAGHGSMLLYSLLHFSGYDVSIDDIKQFRQWNSKTPGHPEFGHTDGIDATSGPLGQGIAMGVGMSIAESFLGEKFNKDDLKVVDHYTYVLCGDGDLQEGVTQEAMSLAGHLGLNKLVVLYDSNDIQLDGPTSLATSENVKQKYTSMNWNYLLVEDGNDTVAIEKAISDSKSSDKPTIIEIKTIIGFGSPLANDSASHGAPLGADHTGVTRTTLGYEHEEFVIADEVYNDFKANVKDRGISEYSKWENTLNDYKSKYPKEYNELVKVIDNNFEFNFDEVLPKFEIGTNEATRVSSGKVLDTLASNFEYIIGGSADLTKSTKAKGSNGNFTKENRGGRNINFGVREHAMGAITNGITLHGGLRPFCSGFFVFSDYLKPTIRMAALMNIPSMFIFTHDSVAVGEDGPTHQPIEQLAMLRSIPNVDVIRPADANETAAAYRLALETKDKPIVLALTRQNLVTMENSNYEGVKRGGYIISPEKDRLDAIIIATGSEVNLAVKAQEELLSQGLDVRVVSMPSFSRFNAQDKEYKESILPITCRKRLGVEMGASYGWHQYIGLDGSLMTIDTFGASAPGNTVIEKYGFTVDNIVNNIKEIL